MKTDAHMHVNFGKRILGTDSLVAYLDEGRFDNCWLLTWEEVVVGKWDYQHLSIEDVFDAYTKYPNRIIPMYAPDPHRPDASSVLRHWVRKGIRGCAELKATLNWASDEVENLLNTVAELRLPVVFHMEGGSRIWRSLDEGNSSYAKGITKLFNAGNASKVYVTPSSASLLQKGAVRIAQTEAFVRIPDAFLTWLEKVYAPLTAWREARTVQFPGYMLDIWSFEGILKKFPQINFVGHGPLFWQHLAKRGSPYGPVRAEGIVCHLLRNYPNMYADISGGSGFNALNRDRRYAGQFLSEFRNKILFGSDNADLDLEGLLRLLNPEKETMRKIMGENAIRLLSGA